jgi:antitoxin HigA-1
MILPPSANPCAGFPAHPELVEGPLSLHGSGMTFSGECDSFAIFPDGDMTETPHFRLKNPPHPGGFVRTEIIDPLSLSVTGAAEALGVTRPALSAFLNERSSLSPEMALRIEKAFGVSMDTLMRMQNSYDISQARAREGEIRVERYRANDAIRILSL